MSAPISTALRQLLLADTTMAGMVGTKIEPFQIGQLELAPAVRYMRVHTHSEQDQDGPLTIKMATFLFTAVALDGDSLESLAEAINSVLNGYRNTALAVTLDDGTTKTMEISLIDESDDADMETDPFAGQEYQHFHRNLFFDIWYQDI